MSDITNNPEVPSQIVAKVSFPKWINQLGIIPTTYKNSMSYYECLAWLCKYLEETVIPTVNQNGEAVEELQALYIELNSYVTNYFNNLDVQEEINKKLDEMTESGELTNIIKNYVDPIYQAYETRINNAINEQNEDITVLEGRMDTFASLTEGSTTGDAELADIRVGANGVTYPTAGDAVRDQLDLKVDKSGINQVTIDNAKYITKERANLLFGLTPHENYWYSPVDGTGGAQNGMFVYENINITTLSGKRLFSYSNGAPANYNGARSVVFRDNNDDFISGIYPTTSNNTYGFEIPSDAVTMDVTFNYTNASLDTKPTEFWIATQFEDFTNYILSENISIPRKDVKNKYYDVQRRIATINFQFDDGNVNDRRIYNIFKGKNATCGFAIISNIDDYRINEYLQYQYNGFEILSHSTDGTGMNDPSVDESVIETKLKNSRKTLENYGFDIHGFVTPYSTMNNKFIPSLRKYYDYGATVYYGEYDGTTTPYQDATTDTCKIKRVSVQLTTLDNMKNAIDDAIENNGFLTFYGHSAQLDTTDNETTANLNSLLDYINEKVADLQCYLLKPSDAIEYYFHERHNYEQD